MYRVPRTFVIALGLILGLGAISVEARQLPSVTPLCAELSAASSGPSAAADDPPCCIDVSKVALQLEDLPSQSYAMKEETTPGEYWRTFRATGPLPSGAPIEISTVIQPVATREIATQAFTQARDTYLKLGWEIVGRNLGVGDDSVAFGGRGDTMLWFMFRRGTYFVDTSEIWQTTGYDRDGLPQATALAGVTATRLDGEIARQRAAFGSPATAQSVPEFKLGFKTLADQLPADVVGTPAENEHFNVSNGNSEQHTTKGLMVWRKADNWTAYTNGYVTWINGPNGVESRLNTDRFDWEKDQPAAAGSTVSAAVASGAGTVTIDGKQYTANVEWGDKGFSDPFLRGAMAYAYNYAPDWRPVADEAADRGTRVRWGTLTAGLEGVYSVQDNTITMNEDLKNESSMVLAAWLAHETYHASHGDVTTSYQCLQGEVDAYRVEAYVWGKMPHSKPSTAEAELDLDALLLASQSGDDNLKNVVVTSPAYQAQCLGSQVH